ncbi:hypothetical protein HZS_506 [Henneguya salminicola]|nr:hypothetical protein HZS_506 [Henneguya salminicola]
MEFYFVVLNIVLISIKSVVSNEKFTHGVPCPIADNSVDVLNFTVYDCNPDRCYYTRKSIINLTVIFIPKRKIDFVFFSISASIYGTNLPLPKIKEDICGNNIICPLYPDKFYILNVNEKVPNVVPKIKTTAIIRVLNEKKQSIICRKVKVTIT